MGRPSKLTPETTERILEAIAGGATQETAARHAGIAPSTHFAWCERGRRALAHAAMTGRAVVQTERRFSEYLEAVETALREYELTLLASLNEAAIVGIPYETTRTVRKAEPTGRTDAQGRPILAVTETTTIERGAKRFPNVAIQLLKWRRPDVYGDRVQVGMPVEEQALLVQRAIEATLDELGIERTPEIGQTVARHLHAVADDADQMAG